MSSVFLSHSHADKPFARKLGADLRRHGHVVWIDEAEILIGDSLIEKIRDGLDRVDYVLALISSHSINSRWVGRELDIASNREIKEARVVVLPALLEGGEVPGFLVGKLYADFREPAKYEDSLASVLRRLGSATSPPATCPSELDQLRRDVAVLKKAVEQQARHATRVTKLVQLHRSPDLQRAIEEENRRIPAFAAINNAYAFEALGIPVTLGYVLHALRKAHIKGGHQLEGAFTVDDRWDNVRLMLEAYADFIGAEDQEDNAERDTSADRPRY